MKFIQLFTLLFFVNIPLNALAEETPFIKLLCSPTKEAASIEVIFPKKIYPTKPFIGFPEIWVTITLEHRKLKRKYVREKVLMIPETHPPGPFMRGQSSDSLYIQLHPQMVNGEFLGSYNGQLFINDKGPDFRGTYFRYMNSELGPGIVCVPELL